MHCDICFVIIIKLYYLLAFDHNDVMYTNIPILKLSNIHSMKGICEYVHDTYIRDTYMHIRIQFT